MRCSKCGWPNVSGAQMCSKCGAPLQETESYGSSCHNDDGIKKTVSETDVFGGNSQHQPVSPTQCPKCGYPLRPGVEKCPNCNNTIGSDKNIPASSNQQFKRRPTRLDAASSGQSFGGTVNPYMTNVDIPPYCSLKPIKRTNERHELEEHEYEGQTIVLNRDNTDSNNPSITSKEQAILSCVEGQWYIEDKSEQHTTFVQPSSPIPIKDGDLILLGNRLFEFHE